MNRVYLVFGEVFASLNHNMLSYQLVVDSLNSNVIGRIHDFLLSLKLIVKEDHIWSLPGDVCSGVLEGSVIRLSESSIELGISGEFAYKC